MAIIVLVFHSNNSYVGTYNYDDQYTITLKQDGTCDFAERGESFYSDGKLKCNYKVENETIHFNRDVIDFYFAHDGTTSKGQGVGSNFTCAQYEGKYSTDNCKETIISIQESAAIGETGMIYKDKTYTKLK